LRWRQFRRYLLPATAAAAFVEHVVSDFKLDFRQLDLLMGIKGFYMMKFRTAATAERRLDRYGL